LETRDPKFLKWVARAGGRASDFQEIRRRGQYWFWNSVPRCVLSFQNAGNGILPQGIGRFGSERPMTMAPWAHLGRDLAGASDDAEGRDANGRVHS
jgi:hypothetical protein